MFGMGGTEIVVILIVALLFLGPDKLPEAAKQISKGIRDIKKQSRVLQRTIEDDEHIGGAIRDLKSALRGEDEPIRVTAKTILPTAAATIALPEVATLSSDPALTAGEPHTDDPDAISGEAGTASPAADAHAALATGGAATGVGPLATGGAAGLGTLAASGDQARPVAGPDAPDEAAPPRLRMSPTAGEFDDDAPRTTAEDDAELAALIRPAANTIARAVPSAAPSEPAPSGPAPSEPASSEPKHG